MSAGLNGGPLESVRISDQEAVPSVTHQANGKHQLIPHNFFPLLQL